MLSIEIAHQLKEAGLEWQPELHDFFAIPMPGLDERYFVITDMLVDLAVVQGWPAITFTGSAEWALDHILQSDAIWVPRETQLRRLVFQQGGIEEQRLVSTAEGSTLTMRVDGKEHVFDAGSGVDALGLALLYLLNEGRPVSV